MLGVFCVIGLGLWALRHPVIAVAYGPLAAFGLLNFLIGNRAIFFSAPILWFGGAWLAITITRYVGVMAEQQFGGEKASETVKRLFGFQWLPATIGGVACLFISWQASPTEYVPRPSFPKPIMAAFEAIDGNVQDEQAVVATGGIMAMLLCCLMASRPCMIQGFRQHQQPIYLPAPFSRLISFKQLPCSAIWQETGIGVLSATGATRTAC